MAQEKQKIGHCDCLRCGKEVPVRQNVVTGALSFSCQDCGCPGYAKKDGSDHYRESLAAVRPIGGAPIAKVDPAVPAPEPAKKPASIFGF